MMTMDEILIATGSGIGLLALIWGAWKFLNWISPCDDDTSDYQ